MGKPKGHTKKPEHGSGHRMRRANGGRVASSPFLVCPLCQKRIAFGASVEVLSKTDGHEVLCHSLCLNG